MRASNIILLWTLHNVCNKNYQNPGKRQEKIKPTLCYGHYITDITLWTSHYRHYGHYDCMTLIMVIILLHANQFCSNLSHPTFQCF